MLSFEEAGALLDQIADSLPSPLVRELSGGIWLSEQTKYHPQSVPEAPLYIMGEYRRDGFGRVIVLFYGSFLARFHSAPPDVWKRELRAVLLHELTHHNESLAGLKDLEITDAINIRSYLDHLSDD